MEEIILVRPNKDFREGAEEYKREHFQHGENELPGSALLDKLPFDEWLELVKNNSNEKTVSPDWVVSSTFFALRKSDSKIIGMIDIRHTLNDFLKIYGGHIGYSVRPTERCKGYATQILKRGLKYCKTIGLDKVMLGCYKDNLPSRKTIINGGGVLEREFIYSEGKTVQVFWIKI
ncbi:GNAT family N-acetyltransferase [Clostridium sporogenes]|uniref:GNAT family N-acetyltransferase n=1 Tax=Clostridium sporogenes TaxID=1509 RepID=UPI003F8ED111